MTEKTTPTPLRMWAVIPPSGRIVAGWLFETKGAAERVRREEYHRNRSARVARVRIAVEDADEIERREAERDLLRVALRALLADTQHAGHDCGDHDCPVAMARQALGSTGDRQ